MYGKIKANAKYWKNIELLSRRYDLIKVVRGSWFQEKNIYSMPRLQFTIYANVLWHFDVHILLQYKYFKNADNYSMRNTCVNGNLQLGFIWKSIEKVEVKFFSNVNLSDFFQLLKVL